MAQPTTCVAVGVRGENGLHMMRVGELWLSRRPRVREVLRRSRWDQNGCKSSGFFRHHRISEEVGSSALDLRVQRCVCQWRQ